MSVWRRALIAAVIPAVLGVLLLGLLRGDETDLRGASVQTIEVASAAVGETLPVSVVTPPGADVSLRVWDGAHEGSYWAEHWDEYMRFYATALDRCAVAGV